MSRGKTSQRTSVFVTSILTLMSVALSTPLALALDRPTNGGLVQVHPEFDTSIVRLIDDSGTETATSSIEWPAGFQLGLPRSDVDSSTGLAYVLWGDEISVLDLVNETNLGSLATEPDGVAWFGLSLDDSTGSLYVVSFNSAEVAIQLDRVDRETGEVSFVGLLPDYLTFPNLDDVAAADGVMYFMTGVPRIWTLDIETLTLGGEIDFDLVDPLGDFATSMDVDANGNLHVVWRGDESDEGWSIRYNLAEATWSEPREFSMTNVHNDLRTTGFSWWAGPQPDSADPDLANTGLDATNMLSGAAILVTAGVLFVARRRRRS